MTKSWAAVIFLALVCASVNLTKAVHMDDTAYLEIARAILVHPLHPMSAQVNWGNAPAPVYVINQPHLVPYALAAVMAVFGTSELALHVLMAAAAFVAIAFFYPLARRLAPAHALLLTALFALGPAFLPGQNLMVDVPMMALWLIFFWAVFSAQGEHAGRRYLIAAVACALACLVKYSSLVLLPVFLGALILRKEWRRLALLAVPMGVLAGYSLFTYLDCGHIHILERSAEPGGKHELMARGIAWIAGLGAVAPFSVMFLSRSALRRFGRWALAAGLAGGLAVVLHILRSGKSAPVVTVLWALFFGNGVFLLGIVLCGTAADFVGAQDEVRHRRRENNLILTAWLAGACLFVVLFAPFMAVRHILPAIPPLLLLLGYNLETFLKPRWAVLGLVLTATLGLVLALSDYGLAGMYRRQAARIVRELPADARIWHVGHWGWQWYAQGAGMLQYDPGSTRLAAGDYVVMPANVVRQSIAARDWAVLREFREVVVESGPTTWVRTMTGNPIGGYYDFALDHRTLPWHPSCAPLETFSIFKVVESADAGLLAELRPPPFRVRKHLLLAAEDF